MKKAILLSFVCIYFLNANNEQEIFNEKYNNYDSSAKVYENNTFDINKLSDINLRPNYDKDITKQDKDLKEIKNNLQTIINNKQYSDNFNNAKNYILYDTDYKNTDTFKIYKKIQEQGLLDNNEKIFIVISSSLSKETIQNYLNIAKLSPNDFDFVLQGVIGNDLSKLKPTLNYLKELNQDNYAYNLSINPKIIRAYNITRVPAVLFIKNFNKELIDYVKAPNINTDDENVFIAYGDYSLDYVLEEINKKANSKKLDLIIKKIKTNFYNKDIKNETK
ncbi:TrbC family F-type conjugative pilus assembly protein [Campylobacter sp. MG1]|uniref:TrbC family F-type conjugative pilus assembly protein n=1 Tax=Campylobacter sp. MG1 TaxID=2976332 RepID=UPI00226C7547|nr:TrbC family F-type conjugative pilus assembly protein [Campylobacter sp. MG1]